MPSQVHTCYQVTLITQLYMKINRIVSRSRMGSLKFSPKWHISFCLVEPGPLPPQWSGRQPQGAWSWSQEKAPERECPGQAEQLKRSLSPFHLRIS